MPAATASRPKARALTQMAGRKLCVCVCEACTGWIALGPAVLFPVSRRVWRILQKKQSALMLSFEVPRGERFPPWKLKHNPRETPATNLKQPAGNRGNPPPLSMEQGRWLRSSGPQAEKDGQAGGAGDTAGLGTRDLRRFGGTHVFHHRGWSIQGCWPIPGLGPGMVEQTTAPVWTMA